MNTPKLRFNIDGGGWTRASIDHLVRSGALEKPLDGNHGSIHPKAEDYVSEGIPFVMANNISNGKIDIAKAAKLSKERADKLQKGFSIEGDVLLTHKGTVGEVAIVPKLHFPYLMLTPQVTYYRVANKDILSNQYLAKYFESPYFQSQLDLYSGGGTRAYIGITEQRKLTIHSPSIKEQAKIASFFEKIDEKISLMMNEHDLLLAYKKGVMQQIFNQEIRFTDKRGNYFPDWEYLMAGEIFINVNNKNHNSELPILSATQDKGMYPRSENGIDIISSEKSISSYKVVDNGDFVISLRSFQGGIEYSEYVGICSPAYTVLRPTKKISDIFYRAYFKKESFISELNSTVVGIRDGKQISYSAFSTLSLPYPSPDEQDVIAKFLALIDKKIALSKSKLVAMRLYKRGLLQKMFI